MSEPAKRPRRHDPDRRERIVDAATDLMVTAGLANVSHRKVAAAADVPLGSITYHFPTLEDLVEEVFTRYVDRCSDRFQQALAATTTANQVPATLAREVMAYLRSGDELALAYELYLGCVRNPRLRKIMNRWLASSRGSLSRYLDPTTARLTDALIEGLILHTLIDERPMSAAQLEDSFRRLISPNTTP